MFKNMPKFCGYVFEESEDRIIGFLTEVLRGPHPQLEQMHLCWTAARELHSVGLVHGDLYKYNMVIQENIVKFLDFEVSELRDNMDPSQFHRSVLMELAYLGEKLADTTGIGDYCT